MEKVPPFSKVHLTNLAELLLYAYQLFDDVMSVIDLFLEYFDLIRDVVTAAAIRRGRAIAATLRNASLPRATEGCLHAQVVLITAIFVCIARLSLSLTAEEWV